MAHAGVAAPLIAEHASAETRAQWLPGLATGVTRVGIGRTALRVTTSGDELILYGHAHSVVDGPEADLLVLRVSDPAADDAVVLVDTTSPGIARTDVATPLALGGANLADLIFDEVRVPAKSRLPHAAVADFDKDDRLWLAVLAVAGTRAALDTTIAYVKERKVFGTPVASFENTKIVLGEALAQCEAAETLIDAVIAERVSSTLTTNVRQLRNCRRSNSSRGFPIRACSCTAGTGTCGNIRYHNCSRMHATSGLESTGVPHSRRSWLTGSRRSVVASTVRRAAGVPGNRAKAVCRSGTESSPTVRGPILSSSSR
ncbi:hypothetical protein FXW78_19770 [Rhodococcus opacus]|nr:hypothetical protein [Rhodococcus opacus]